MLITVEKQTLLWLFFSVHAISACKTCIQLLYHYCSYTSLNEHNRSDSVTLLFWLNLKSPYFRSLEM